MMNKLTNDYPKVIEIQFQNQCNSDCIICPYRSMGYLKETMSSELFARFVAQLEPNKLTRIIPYLNNEPFMDKDFISKVEQIRAKCPNNELEISTNASMLNEKLIEALLPLNLTDLRISVFGFEDDTYKRMMPNLNKAKVFENLKLVSLIFSGSKTKVTIVMIDDGTIKEQEFEAMKQFAILLGFDSARWGFLDRAKNVCGKSNNFHFSNVCGCEQNRPIERMHILSSGEVIFCCQDWSHTLKIGSIAKNTIREIWNSSKYNELRESLYNENLTAPFICQNCKLAEMPIKKA